MKLEAILGIGPKAAKSLRAAGVGSVEQLLTAGTTRAGRKSLAEATKLDGDKLLTWINHADLFRVNGIGATYGQLLEAAGVDTIKELRTRRPDNLHAAIVATNKKKSLTKRPPSEKMIAGWIKAAKATTPVVKY